MKTFFGHSKQTQQNWQFSSSLLFFIYNIFVYILEFNSILELKLPKSIIAIDFIAFYNVRRL